MTRLPVALFCTLSLGAYAAGPLSVEQQNAIVKTHCAVCHTDAARNGGLSLEHFDAAKAPPSLAALMLNKLGNGALGAAGNGVPDKATEEAFTQAFIAQSRDAGQWHVDKSSIITASVLRDSPTMATTRRQYRLIVSCDAGTQEGSIQLAWSPLPGRGTLNVTIDDAAPLTYAVEGSEKMGNGNPLTTGPAAVMLAHAPLPARSLRIMNLFPDDTVEFSFSDLPASARSSFSACFR